MLLTWRIGRQLYGARAGLYAGLVLATVAGNALYVRKASTDQLFVFCLALALYGDLDLSLLDGIVTIKSDEAIEMARRLAKEEGIFCGISSGANVSAAIKLANRHPKMKRIVTMICDSGQRYFSTELCGSPKHIVSPEREHPIDEYTRGQLDKYQSGWEIID